MSIRGRPRSIAAWWKPHALTVHDRLELPAARPAVHKRHESKRSQIENKPYHPREGVQHIWDPLQESIGVTLGDVGILGQANVLVEGITEQVLLANASEAFAAKGKPHFDLATISILPYGDASALDHLIAVARSRTTRVVVLADADEQGAKARRFCEREGVAYTSVGDFAERAEGDRSVENVLGAAVGRLKTCWAQPFTSGP